MNVTVSRFQMKNTSRNINIHGGIDKQDPNVSIPDTWAENSNRNIQDSQGTNLLPFGETLKIYKS